MGCYYSFKKGPEYTNTRFSPFEGQSTEFHHEQKIGSKAYVFRSSSSCAVLRKQLKPIKLFDIAGSPRADPHAKYPPAPAS